MGTSYQTIKWLLSYVRPLRLKMFFAIFLGTLSYLTVIAIPVLGATLLVRLLNNQATPLAPFIIAMIACGLLRGIFRYGEQYLNHAIAFSLLAIVRDKVFNQLRKLAPAKLQGKKSGDLIALITSDVEALEVFFAHTVSPVCIAFITSMIVTIGLTGFHWLLGLISFAAFLAIGIVIPIIQYKNSTSLGEEYKQCVSNLNQTVIEQLNAIHEIKLYHLQTKMATAIDTAGTETNNEQKKILLQSIRIQNLAEISVLFFSTLMLFTSYLLQLNFSSVLLATILMMSSFGPVLALSGLGNALLTTLASGNRLKSLLEEMPITPDIENGKKCSYTGGQFQDVNFTYSDSDKEILHGLTLSLPKKGILGIGGPSGIGKSTFLRLFMRFWEATTGSIFFSTESINTVNTASLRNQEGYMEQNTFLFEASLYDNITLGKNVDSSLVESALKKAALLDWANALPDGIQTIIGEKSRPVSDGEKQRIALARIFLYDTPLMLLDEPTSNLDYLNEKIILQALEQEKETRAIILVSHRPTTLAIAEQIIDFKELNQ